MDSARAQCAKYNHICSETLGPMTAIFLSAPARPPQKDSSAWHNRNHDMSRFVAEVYLPADRHCDVQLREGWHIFLVR